jgi:hypothetical protein
MAAMQFGIDSFHPTAPDDLRRQVVLKAKNEPFSNPRQSGIDRIWPIRSFVRAAPSCFAGRALRGICVIGDRVAGCSSQSRRRLSKSEKNGDLHE